MSNRQRVLETCGYRAEQTRLRFGTMAIGSDRWPGCPSDVGFRLAAVT